MAHRTVHHLACLVSLLAVASTTSEQARWSRQLSPDTGDWVPLRGPAEEPEIQTPVKRQAIAEPRVLTEPFSGLPRPTGYNSDIFSSRNYFNAPANRQLYLQSMPSIPTAPQNYLTDQGFGQGIRFGLSQPNFPLNQGFVAGGFDNIPAPPSKSIIRTPNLSTIPMSQVSFPQSAGLPVSFQEKPYLNSAQKFKSDTPKFVDGYRAENASNEFLFSPKKKPQSLQKIKFESGEKVKQEIIPQRTKNEKGEEVQLLYVPLEQLNRGQFNFRSPLTSSQLVNTDTYSQNLPRPNQGNPNFVTDFRPSAKPLDTFPGQNFFADFNAQFREPEQVSKYTTHTTPFPTHAPITVKPKKLKPHQPPLAIFTKNLGKRSPLKVGDVLSSLKSAESIAVLDSVNPLTAPHVFIGPSNMPPPDNFVKFDLPYLSNIDHSDSKLKQLPFFVAPLSYNTPNGFAKIPFPSPHVGSVVINSQIKDTAQTQASSLPNINSNRYLDNYRAETQKPVTQKPTFSYYSTVSPKTKPTTNYQSNYYSFEPQTVTSHKTSLPVETQTPPPKTGSYFLSNAGPQYNSQEYTNFAPQNTYKTSEIDNQFNHPKQPERVTTLRTTTPSTTTKLPSTYPSQLLETHNPYSINHAFHFSTPLDYHNYFDDIKQPYVTPGAVETSSPSPSPSPSSPPSAAPITEFKASEKPKYLQQFSPSYLNNYTPEIHYNIDQSPKYPIFNGNEYTGKEELTSQKTQPPTYVDNTEFHKYISSNTDIPNNKYSTNIDTTGNQYVNPAVTNYNFDNYNKYNANFDTSVNTYKADPEPPVNQYNTNTDTVENYKTEHYQNVDTSSFKPENPSDIDNTPTRYSDDQSNQYEEHNNYGPDSDITTIKATPSTSTSTTTTRRSPIRTRGRPRYTTTPRTESYESTTKVATTRRPIRERRPLPSRSRYEPNKISSDKTVDKSLESSESTTKSSKTRTRGRVHFKPSDSEELYDRKKTSGTKDQDLAYQRDVLHQNYPVTLMERGSTIDIEAITEPTIRQSSENVQKLPSETVDTENAYTYEKASVSEVEETKEISPLSTFTSRNTYQTETPYVPKLSSTRNDDYYYQSRSSVAPVEASGYDETANGNEEDIYVKHTTPVTKIEKVNPTAYVTEPSSAEESVPSYSSYIENVTVKEAEDNTAPATDNTKIASSENTETDDEENAVQTTPSYNRVRVRPGAVRQYHQASSTESPKVKERRRPSQPVTYRPAFERRRTTMRIDEIEADLKTKQVHVRPEQEHKHPVYKPEATTEPVSVVSSTTETTTKRNYRRRRPSHSYSTTSTEATSTKRTYEVKNRFRGRRPERTTEKSEVTTEAPSSTSRNTLHSRYSHRTRLSERYNKKAQTDVEIEDQDTNYSINRPKFAELESEQWSPKITGDSFKPYNPNDIVDENKIATTERNPEKESELDIITAKNEYDDILLTVTPASNNRMKKKIPDIPPTLEALVEQSKVTSSDSGDAMSTFESMLEEVMKSLEEQDKDEYNSKVKKHKGGEIGEIPPEKIISSGDNYVPKSTAALDEIVTEATTADEAPLDDEEVTSHPARRRGFWKKVKVRPVTESIEAAESQYYGNTINRLGQNSKSEKTVHEKSENNDKSKVTTYKPKFQFLSDFFSSGDDLTGLDDIPQVEINKVKSNQPEIEETTVSDLNKQTTVPVPKEIPTFSPGDLDLGTGSPDPTIDDMYTTPTEPVPTKADDRSDAFSFMNYLFGVTSDGDDTPIAEEEKNVTNITNTDIPVTTESSKPKILTTESGFIPEEITTSLPDDESTDIPELVDITKIISPEDSESISEDTTVIPEEKVESSSVSSFMDPVKVMSTSMSTEISHETEICFRGRCIKSNKDLL